VTIILTESYSRPWDLWIDKEEILNCVQSGKNKSLVELQTKEGASLFGLTWTPWNVFINNKTWKWDKLPWAYPYESFVQKIDSLLK
jgi:protein-disulfide isomerase